MQDKISIHYLLKQTIKLFFERTEFLRTNIKFLLKKCNYKDGLYKAYDYSLCEGFILKWRKAKREV